MRHAPLFKYKVPGAFDFLRHIFHGRITLSPASVSLKTHAAAGVFRLRAALKAVHRGYSQQEFFN